MKQDLLQFDTANGATTAYVAEPARANSETPTVILIQEYWGLTQHIKDIAGRYAAENIRAVAPDLYRGKIAENSAEAKQLMDALAIEDGLDTILNTIEKIRSTRGSTRKLGISGYCMGGTYVLRAACEYNEIIGAACPFYGDIPPENVLRHLTAPVRFFAGTKHAWINPEKVDKELRQPAAKYGLPVEIFTYEADHAFFNSTRTEVYNMEAAADAWTKNLQLFNSNL